MKLCYSCMQPIDDKENTTCPHCGEPLQLSCDTTKFLKPRTVLQNKFVVGKVLGAGGFGITYIGWNQVLQCRVAIKEYYPRMLSKRSQDGATVTLTDTTKQQRFRLGLHQFLEEAKSIANLQDVKGVIKIFNFFEENGTGYIVMEFLEGMDVKQILKETNNKAGYEWSRRVVLTVLHILRDIHKRGVLHRDIAPDNIFVTKEGVIKLIDFGAAKYVTQMANPHSDIVLKVGYAPIEQYSKKAKQGPYTDLYAVAALFYRLLTGQKPQAANERIANDQLKSLSELGVKIPQQAEFAIMMCLSIQPQFRLQSAQEFMEALDGADFEPVYEPEWILPDDMKESEKGIKALGKKIASLPVAAKAGIVVAVIALAGGSVALGMNLTQHKQIETGESKSANGMPDWVSFGTQIEKADQKAKNLGLKTAYNYEYHQDEPEDKIIRCQIDGQDSNEGQKVTKGTTLNFTVASSSKVSIIDYKNSDKAAIEQDLAVRFGDLYNKNKDKMIFEHYNKDVPKDICYDQTVQPGSVLALSNMDQFKLYLSWGKESDYVVKMPDLTGKAVAQAKKVLAKKNIKVKYKINQLFDDTAKIGTIVGDGQEPKKGTKVNTNMADKLNVNHVDTVILWVSKGPEATPTPEPTVEPTVAPTKKPAKTQAPTTDRSVSKKKSSSKKKAKKDSDSVRFETNENNTKSIY
ncbi:protein kinase domain-containing protein [Jutongia hominis]|uniref:Protein kinase n=1 Tax=Jutongia hominis TaxID=2763664 RepID=A0ABR7MUH5_9FIRM|nr:protein kinase [Jutongia hominis]MBC8557461.1 protein kinase [Jutongia hominis]